MKTSQYFLANLKETSSDTELISYQLMLRAGMIRKLAAGIVTWLPLGLRVLQKVKAIVREEMNKIGALEVSMPNVQTAELWQESGRWQQYGTELLRFQDRNQRDFCFGPTHEEVVTDIVRHELRSYKQVPLLLYQIQTKFRDEIRPRFGVMRGREFLMKDAYSFAINQTDLQVIYQQMYDAYCRIFQRLGLKFRAVEADPGTIGGTISHEFQVLAHTGEDIIVYSNESDYAANLEKATTLLPVEPRPEPSAILQMIDTPAQRTITKVCEFLDISPQKIVKVLIVNGFKGGIVALALRGDHQLNKVKAQHHHLVADPLTFVDEQEIETILGCHTGFVGPIGLEKLGIPMIVDHAAAQLSDFCCGANVEGQHIINANWGRDCPEPDVYDLRNVTIGEPSPDGRGILQLARGIEVGHIFQLGTKYSDPMKAKVLDKQGNAVSLQMGCYGLGISRIIAAAIEQHYDARGIIWPISMAPFHIVIVPMNYHKSHRVRDYSERLYQRLRQAGYEVLLDDRKEQPGVLFATADLIGIPHRFVVSEKVIDQAEVEYKARWQDDKQVIADDQLLGFLHDVMR